MDRLISRQMYEVAGGLSTEPDAAMLMTGGAAAGGLGAISGMPAGASLGEVAAAGSIGALGGAGLGLAGYGGYQLGTAIYNAYDVEIGGMVDATVGFLASIW